MNVGRLGRCAVLALCLAAIGCGSGAYWDVNKKAPAYRVPGPMTLYVIVSNQVNESDTDGAVVAALDSLEAELRAAGHEVRVVPARGDEKPPIRASKWSFRSFAPAMR